MDFVAQQSILSSRRQYGTGTWFFECETFQKWTNCKGKYLIGEGMPGAGERH